MRRILKAIQFYLPVCLVLACAGIDEPGTADFQTGLICLAPGLDLGSKSSVSGRSFPADRSIIMSATYMADGASPVSWFDNATFTKKGAVWSSDKYWPQNGILSILAYSADGLTFDEQPYTDSELDCWVLQLPQDYCEKQVDILFSSVTVSAGGALSSSPLNLCFTHAMAELAFTAESNVAWDAGTGKGIIVDSIFVTNIYMDGELRLYNGRSIEFDVSSSNGPIGRLEVPNSGAYQVPGEPLALSASGGNGIGSRGLLVPPQDGTGICINYTVWDGGLFVSKTLEYEVSEVWESNQKYVYNLSFDGETLLLELKPRYLKITSSVPNYITVSNPRYYSENAPTLEYSLDGVSWEPMPWYTGPHGSSTSSGTVGDITVEAWDVPINEYINSNKISSSAEFLIPFESVIYIRGDNPDGLAVPGDSGSIYHATQFWFRYGYHYIGWPSNCEIQIEGDLKYLLSHTEDLTEISQPYCFASLFSCTYLGDSKCVSITKLPNLDVDTISGHGCMFRAYACCDVQTPPILSATSLSKCCYERCFEFCNELLESPVIAATRKGNHCYNRMFKNCRSLSRITADYYYTGGREWVSGVAEEGTFVITDQDAPTDSDIADKRGVNNIPEGWTVVHPASGKSWEP